MNRLVACVLLVAGCGSKDLGAPCARHSDCNTGVCGSDGKCAEMAEETPDGVTPDASTEVPSLDAGAPSDAPDDEGL